MTSATLETTPEESSSSSTSKVGFAAYWGTTGVLALRHEERAHVRVLLLHLHHQLRVPSLLLLRE